MEKEIKREIIIKARNRKEAIDIGNHISTQLCGQDDFINNNIIVTIPGFFNDELEEKENTNTVIVTVFNECKNIPPLVIY